MQQSCASAGSRLGTVGGLGRGLTIEHPVSLNGVELVGKCEIGAYSYLGKGCELRATRVGRFCSIARRVTTGLAEHPTDRLSTHPFAFNPTPMFAGDAYLEALGPPPKLTPSSRQGLTEIGHDVRIGDGAFISRGVRIGTGAVIAARAVVTRDVAPYSIVAGVPARHIRYRFDEALCERLLASAWFDKDLRGLGLDPRDVAACLDAIEAADPPPLTPERIEIIPNKSGKSYMITAAPLL